MEPTGDTKAGVGKLRHRVELAGSFGVTKPAGPRTAPLLSGDPSLLPSPPPPPGLPFLSPSGVGRGGDQPPGPASPAATRKVLLPPRGATSPLSPQPVPGSRPPPAAGGAAGAAGLGGPRGARRVPAHPERPGRAQTFLLFLPHRPTQAPGVLRFNRWGN